MEEYERCYQYGEYTDQYCGDCPYKEICSGYEEDNDDD